MDRKIEKKRFTPKRLIPIIIISIVLGFLTYQVIIRSGKTRLKIDPTRITVSQVKYGELENFYPFDGIVVPITSVIIDAAQGGRIEEIFVEGGEQVEKRDLILRLSNPETQRNLITQETQILDTIDRAQATMNRVVTNNLMLRRNLLDYNYDILNLERQFERYEKLFKVGDITEEEFERARDNLSKAKEKMELLKEEIREDEILGEKQIEHAENSIIRGNRSLDLLSKTMESLDITADISGTITSLNGEIGQRIPASFRIGQIDRLDSFKVRAAIDQYYLPKVDVGTEGTFSFDGEKYVLTVKKIYPEINANSEFTVDMLFKGETPEGIKRGQVLTISLRLGDPVEGLLVKLGGFQQAGSRWIYLISEDQTRAFQQPIRQGIKNPRYVEIIEGLKEGDWVITSGYDTFKEADELIFKTPLRLDKL